MSQTNQPANRTSSKMIKGQKEFLSGLSITAVFGVLYFWWDNPWWVIFPIVFAGIAPMVRGATMWLQERRRKTIDEPREEQIQNERIVLNIARKNNGVVTPSLLTIESSLSIDKSEELLQNLASRGIATMDIQESGRVEYTFIEFLPSSRNQIE